MDREPKFEIGEVVWLKGNFRTRGVIVAQYLNLGTREIEYGVATDLGTQVMAHETVLSSSALEPEAGGK